MNNRRIFLMKTLGHFRNRTILCLQHMMEVYFFSIYSIWCQPILHKLLIG